MLCMLIGVYGVLKVVLYMLVKCIGMELVFYGICCNLVSFGFICIVM